MTTYTITVTTATTDTGPEQPIVQLTVSEETARYCTFWSALQNIVKEHLGRPKATSAVNAKMPLEHNSDATSYGPGHKSLDDAAYEWNKESAKRRTFDLFRLNESEPDKEGK